MSRGRLLVLSILFEGAILAAAWLSGAALGYPAFGELRPSWQAAAYGLLASLPILAGLALGARSGWGPLAEIRRTILEISDKLFARSTLADLAIISALAGIGEEALFRGVLQAALADHLGIVPALLLASIAFGLAHFISPAYALFAAVIGLYLGVLFVATGSLLVPVLAHAGFDFIALAWLVHVRGAGGGQPLPARPE